MCLQMSPSCRVPLSAPSSAGSGQQSQVPIPSLQKLWPLHRNPQKRSQGIFLVPDIWAQSESPLALEVFDWQEHFEGTSCNAPELSSETSIWASSEANIAVQHVCSLCSGIPLLNWSSCILTVAPWLHIVLYWDRRANLTTPPPKQCHIFWCPPISSDWKL